MKNICVIGGSGFVGTRLIQQIGKENCYNIDKNPSPFYNEITEIQNICQTDLAKALSTSTSIIVLLAAEHTDDILPVSLYYEVNVQGTKNVLEAMDKNNIRNIIFTSSVAIYGLNKHNPDENQPADPFNHYGKSKWQAEEVLRAWYQKDKDNRSLTIIRPTVIFGERNRGNVYNLLKQLASGRFFMIGSGENKKSMAYVENVSAFIQHCIITKKPGYRVYNYVDKPDFTMNKLLMHVESSLGRKLTKIRIPYLIGLTGAYLMDFWAQLSRKKFTISAIRIKKFCATTQFDAKKIHSSGFVPPYTIVDGLNRTIDFEFHEKQKDTITFQTE